MIEIFNRFMDNVSENSKPQSITHGLTLTDVDMTEAEAVDISKMANQISGSNGSTSLIKGIT